MILANNLANNSKIQNLRIDNSNSCFRKQKFVYAIFSSFLY